MQTLHEYIVFASGCALAALHMAILIRGTAIPDLRERIKSALAIRTWTCCKQARNADPLSAYVATMVGIRVLKQARHFYRTGGLCLQIMMLGILVTLLGTGRRWLTPELDRVFMVAYVSVIVCVYAPRVLRASTVAMWYSYFMLAMIVSLIAVPKEVLPTLCNGLMVLRFLLGLCCLKMPLIALWNFAFWLTASLWYAWNSTDCSQVPSNSVFITCEFWSAMVLTLSLRGIRTDMVAGIHRDIEAKASYNEHSAVRSILMTLCNAVVELDTEFKIAERAQELSCMLLRGHDRSMLGVPFSSLMASDDDRAHCMNFLSKDRGSGTSMASAFHTCMHDSLNNKLHVEIFHVNFLRGLHENLHHFIGVREYTDGQPVQSFDGPPQCLSSELESWGQEVQVPCFRGYKPYDVQFDAFTFSMLGWSSAFLNLCGTSPLGQSFKEWVKDDVREHFLQQYSEAVNDFINADHVSEGLLFQSLPLIIPAISGVRVELNTVCHIKFCLPESSELHTGGNEIDLIAVAKFPNLMPHRKPSKPRRAVTLNQSRGSDISSESVRSSDGESCDDVGLDELQAQSTPALSGAPPVTITASD